jgi:hypothetical protein
MMTKKDFIKAAEITRCSRPNDRLAIRESFIALFITNNPKFDIARFDAACMPKTEIDLAREVAATLSYKKR